MESLGQKITDAVKGKLNDGTVEKLVSRYVEKGIDEALSSLFSYGGEGKRLIEKKLGEVLVPAIEAYDFSQYLIKLDSVLTELVNSAGPAGNRKILENFRGLMEETGMEEIRMSEIFGQYRLHVAGNVSTCGLKACHDGGEPYYEHVTALMEEESRDRGWYARDNRRAFKFTCEEDEGLDCRIELYRHNGEGFWRFRAGDGSMDINSLRWVNDFEVFLFKLKREHVKIILDVESACDDDIEPEEKPEWRLG